LPSAENLQEMKDSLQYKETQVGLSQTTVIRLQEELNQRKLELVKMNNLDSRIVEESQSLQQQMTKMKSELLTFGDIDLAKKDYEKQRQVIFIFSI
jgi:intraflagellar transport protein 74